MIPKTKRWELFPYEKHKFIAQGKEFLILKSHGKRLNELNNLFQKGRESTNKEREAVVETLSTAIYKSLNKLNN